MAHHSLTEVCLMIKDLSLKDTPSLNYVCIMALSISLPTFTPLKTNGQVERMNCTIKEAILRFFHYNTIQ